MEAAPLEKILDVLRLLGNEAQARALRKHQVDALSAHAPIVPRVFLVRGNDNLRAAIHEPLDAVSERLLDEREPVDLTLQGDGVLPELTGGVYGELGKDVLERVDPPAFGAVDHHVDLDLLLLVDDLVAARREGAPTILGAQLGHGAA